MNRIYCVGESVVNFTQTNNNFKDIETFMRIPSGSAINVAVTISKLGGVASVVSKIGNDGFGRYINKVLLENNIETNNLVQLGKSSLKFITLDEESELIIGDYEDYELEIREEISMGDIVHFSSALAFSHYKLKENYYELLKYVKRQGAYISFDPNYKSQLIDKKDIDNFRKDCWEFIKEANCVKLSLEEALLLANTNKLEEAIAKILEEKLETVFINLGEKGTVLFNNDQFIQIPTISVHKENFYGAGDSFVGAILYKLVKCKYSGFNMEEWKDIVTFANKVGALICKTEGGIMSIDKIDLE